jgi:DNA-binding transcriptional ArsR family regulator
MIDMLKDGRKSISEISTALGQEENIISHNLRPLQKCALLLSEGSGEERFYSLNREISEPLSELLVFHVDKYCPEFKECVPAEKFKEYMKAEAAKITYIEHE